ncbi:MAG: spermidine/putrescine ABC transporter substrate-binding protein [Clostridiales bacterium]|nr:spermidine/putrescine ABC transporter substrate-binding protein [Clostridiales bacterium]
MKRKSLKKRGLLIGALLFLLAAMICLSACGGPKIYIYTWGDYLDPDVIKEFEKETGIKVKYVTFETNEAMYTKISRGGAKYDVIICSDYIVERMIAADLLLELDYEKIPNAQHIDPTYKGLPYDPGDKYSVPYTFGTMGIIYNKKMVTETVDSWEILWDEKYKNNIIMMDSMRDTFLVPLAILKHDINTTDRQKLEEAKDLLVQQRPLVRAYLVDRIRDDMKKNEAALALIWSCDFLLVQFDNTDLEYVIPKEGSNLWVDAFVVPKASRNQEYAQQFIDFMCSKDAALGNSVYINGPTPQLEARAAQPEQLRNNPAAYPSPEELERCRLFADLDAQARKLYDELWHKAKTEKP